MGHESVAGNPGVSLVYFTTEVDERGATYANTRPLALDTPAIPRGLPLGFGGYVWVGRPWPSTYLRDMQPELSRLCRELGESKDARPSPWETTLREEGDVLVYFVSPFTLMAVREESQQRVFFWSYLIPIQSRLAIPLVSLEESWSRLCLTFNRR